MVRLGLRKKEPTSLMVASIGRTNISKSKVKNYWITDVQLADEEGECQQCQCQTPRSFFVQDEPDRVYIKWFYDASNSPDFGDSSGGSSSGQKIYGFGHGPLNGKIYIPSKMAVNFSAINLPKKTFFEVRVLFEKNLINTLSSENISDNITLSQILAEEEKFAQYSATGNIQSTRSSCGANT